jgi:peptidyl-prolyl cis-trans isomerase C
VKHSLFILAFCAILSAQTPTPVPMPQPVPGAPAVDPNTVIITVGDHKITAGQYDELVKTLPQQYQEIARGPGRRQFAQNLVELSVLADEATKMNLDKNADMALQIQFQRENLLAQAMFQALQANATVSDADVQAYYDAHKADYETLTARHILIRSKGAPMPATPGKPELEDAQALAKAQSVRKRITGGEDFAKVAKEESDDTSSGEQGGNLGEFKRGMMVPPFEEAAFGLKVGDVSEPVKTPFGYHIIQVQTHSAKSLADVKAEILTQLKPELARKAVAALIDKAKFDINPNYFGPDPAAQGATPGPPPASR